MALWGNRDQYSDAPKFVVEADTGDTGQQQFGNTVFLADQAEIAANKDIGHSGWVRRRVGTGYVTSLVINAGGTGYANTDTIKVSNGTSNATATLTTNSTGGIVNTTLTSGGGGFSNIASSVLSITTSAGTGANVTFTLGGRAGRITWEPLVAIVGAITTDATDFANTSNSAVANSTGTADDSILSP